MEVRIFTRSGVTQNNREIVILLQKRELEIANRPFRNLEKGTTESAPNSDSLGSSRKSGESPLLR